MVYFHETVCTSKHCTDSGSDTHSKQPLEFKPNRTDFIHDWPLDNYYRTFHSFQVGGDNPKVEGQEFF